MFLDLQEARAVPEMPASFETEVPPRPARPGPGDCCGSGCKPCVFDNYRTALKEWKAIVVCMGFDPAQLGRAA